MNTEIPAITDLFRSSDVLFNAIRNGLYDLAEKNTPATYNTIAKFLNTMTSEYDFVKTLTAYRDIEKLECETEGPHPITEQMKQMIVEASYRVCFTKTMSDLRENPHFINDMLVRAWEDDEQRKKFNLPKNDALKSMFEAYNDAMSDFKNERRDTSSEQPERLQRAIDSERLGSYFNANFKGMGNGSINHFDWLVRGLEIDRVAKDFGRIALMCYDSGKMNNNRPKTFLEWYKIFCECVGCEMKSYDRNKLTDPSDTLKIQFNYLQ